MNWLDQIGNYVGSLEDMLRVAAGGSGVVNPEVLKSIQSSPKAPPLSDWRSYLPGAETAKVIAAGAQNPRYVGAYNLGGEVTDLSKSPALGALVYALTSGWDPNENGSAYQFGGKVTDWTKSPTAGALAYSLLRPFEGGPGQAATVFHGSPHDFEKFQMEKVGTGEGAQAYGHGLYFAENPGVAKSYAEQLGQFGWKNPEVAAKYDPQTLEVLKTELVHHSPEEIMSLNKQYAELTHGTIMKDMYNALKSGDANFQGNLYKVDLPDEAISKMLDWDRPVMDLPFETRQLLKKAGAKIADYAPNTQTIGDVLPRTDAASEILRQAGIPGIKYLDQGSRAAGKGTYNYVVFDENLPKILEKVK